ncbi:MAG TPA: hypothetical protein VNV85_04960, partial [Puia sp.]|nr:hypothetical protein [Puia sp.]
FHYLDDVYKPLDANNENTAFLTDKSIKQANKKLAARIKLAISNLYDSVELQQFYKSFWGTVAGTDVYATLMDKLTALASILDDDSKDFDIDICRTKNVEFLGICDLEKSLKQSYKPYQVTVKFNGDSSRYEINIIKTNLFQKRLQDYWVNILNGLPDKTFGKPDREYKRAWDDISHIVERSKLYDSLLHGVNHLSCYSPPNLDSLFDAAKKFVADTLHLLDDDKVIKMVLKNKEYYKEAFWFNYGYFSTNPLGFTTAAQTYKVSLFDKEAARLHDSAVAYKIYSSPSCCSLTMNGVDSLIRLRNTGAKLFSTDTLTDPVWGFNDLYAFRASEKLINKFQVPVSIDDNHPQLLLQFDGAGNYYAVKDNKRYKAVTSSDSVSFVVHNIAPNVSVNITQVSQNTTNTSSFQDAVASISSVSGLNTAASAIGFGPQNPQTPYYNFPNTSSHNLITGQLQEHAVQLKLRRGGFLKARKASNPDTINISLPINGFGNHNFIVIKSQRASDLLDQYCTLISGGSCDKGLISFFFAKCENNTSFYGLWENEGLAEYLRGYLSDLIKSFIDYNESNKNKFVRIKQLKDGLEKYDFINYLASITDRSLPPPIDSLKPLIDSVPAFRTLIFPIPVYDSTRAVQATIVAKKIVKKDTTTITHPIYPSTRIGSMVRFAFSAGITITTNMFYEKTASFTGTQLNVANKASTIGYLVGVHIYPCKYFQIDDSFLGFKNHHFRNRLSFYAGLGLPNPLSEYYGGLSADLVPGFKLVAGAHLYLNTRYEITDNQIAAQASAVKWAGPFISFCIDPSAFVTVLGLFK